MVLCSKKMSLNKEWLFYCLYLENKIRMIIPFAVESREVKGKKCWLKSDTKMTTKLMKFTYFV